MQITVPSCAGLVVLPALHARVASLECGSQAAASSRAHDLGRGTPLTLPVTDATYVLVTIPGLSMI
jgi:hypothetical protein